MDEFAKIEYEYISGADSYKTLSEKYGVLFSRLCSYARENEWAKKRKEYRETGADGDDRIEKVTLRLIEKLERAIDELDEYVVTTKTKEKTLEYDDEGKKTVRETVIEGEKLNIEKGLIDRAALKQLVVTLRELRGREENEDEGIEVYMGEDTDEYSK